MQKLDEIISTNRWQFHLIIEWEKRKNQLEYGD